MNRTCALTIGSVAAALLCCACGAGRDADPDRVVAQACQTKHLQINRVAAVPELCVDLRFLSLLPNSETEPLPLDDLVRFFFEARLQALETDNSVTLGATGFTWIHGLPAERPGRVLRLTIRPSGDPACAMYHSPTRYPAQALPWLPTMGLAVDRCVGIEVLPKPSATSGIHVHEEVLGRPFGGQDWQSRLQVTLSDPARPWGPA